MRSRGFSSLGALAASLEGPLVDAVTGRVRQAVHRVVTSDAASSVWAQGHRTVHAQLVAVLRGDPDAVATLDADAGSWSKKHPGTFLGGSKGGPRTSSSR